MRRLQKGKRKKPRKKAEPLAEGLRKKRRPYGFFSGMNDDELVGYARGVIEDKDLKGRGELQRIDRGVYKALRKRGLLDRIAFEENRRKRRDWSSMSDDEIVLYAVEIIDEKKAGSRKELLEADQGLYVVLRERGLLDDVIPVPAQEERRPWGFFSRMSDAQVIAYARRVMREKGLKYRNALYKGDQSLYHILRKRKLIGLVFAPIESQNRREAVQQVVDAMKEFGA